MLRSSVGEPVVLCLETSSGNAAVPAAGAEPLQQVQKYKLLHLAAPT